MILRYFLIIIFLVNLIGLIYAGCPENKPFIDVYPYIYCENTITQNNTEIFYLNDFPGIFNLQYMERVAFVDSVTANQVEYFQFDGLTINQTEVVTEFIHQSNRFFR